MNIENGIHRIFFDIRKSKGLSQMQLSQKTGIAQCDISRIENGHANPSIKTLQRLAAGLDTMLALELSPTKTTPLT